MESGAAADKGAPLLTVLLTSVSRCQMSLSRALPGVRKSDMSGLGRLSFHNVSVAMPGKDERSVPRQHQRRRERAGRERGIRSYRSGRLGASSA